MPASTKPPAQLLPTKDESPWKSYNKEYTVELGGLIIMAERKYPAYRLIMIKEFSGYNTESKLLSLR